MNAGSLSGGAEGRRRRNYRRQRQRRARRTKAIRRLERERSRKRQACRERGERASREAIAAVISAIAPLDCSSAMRSLSFAMKSADGSIGGRLRTINNPRRTAGRAVRTAHTDQMSMHSFHVDRRKCVIDKANMVLSKRATMHRVNSLHDGFASGTRQCGRGSRITRAISHVPGAFDHGTDQEWYRELSDSGRKKAGANCRAGFSFYPFSELSIDQSSQGSMIAANAFRARFSRDFTVPRLQSVISAISSYDFPSSSRSTNTCR